MSTDAPPEGAAAGWYAAEPGFVRWWDGTAWGPPKPAEADVPDTPAATPRPSTRLSPDRTPGAPGRAPAPLLPHATAGDRTRTLVTLTHLGCILGGVIMPLTVYLVEKRHPFVRHHAAEALNFQLTCLLIALVSIPLMLVYVGFFTFLGVVVLNWTCSIVASRRAARGVWWRYPVNLRLVRA